MVSAVAENPSPTPAPSNSLSVFAQGRFTQGSGTIDVGGQKVSVNAGGAQARVGLRLIVARRTSLY